MNQRWIAVRTHMQADGRVYLGIEAAGIPVFAPFERTAYRDRGQRCVKIRPLFPGYVFARLDPSLIGRILEIDGAEDVLRVNDGKVGLIPDEVIDALRRARDMGAFDYTGHQWAMPGDEVQLADGALVGLIAKVKSAQRHKRIELIGDFAFRLVVSADRLEKMPH